MCKMQWETRSGMPDAVKAAWALGHCIHLWCWQWPKTFTLCWENNMFSPSFPLLLFHLSLERSIPNTFPCLTIMQRFGIHLLAFPWKPSISPNDITNFQEKKQREGEKIWNRPVGSESRDGLWTCSSSESRQIIATHMGAEVASTGRTGRACLLLSDCECSPMLVRG